MKPLPLLSLIVAIAAMNFTTANADIVAEFDFTDGDTTGLTQGAGIAGTTATGGTLQVDGSQTGPTPHVNLTDLNQALGVAINANSYLGFSVAIPDTQEVDIKEVNLDYSVIAPFDFVVGVFSSATGFTAGDQLGGAFANSFSIPSLTSPIDVSVETALQGLTDTTVEFRIYLSDQSTSDTRIHVLDNISVHADITSIAVPEPSSMALLGLGGVALLARRRK